MRKNLKKSTLIAITLVASLALVGCGGASKDVKVEVTSDAETYTLAQSNVKGMTLTCKTDGKLSEKVVYHWRVEGVDGEGFLTNEGMKTDITTMKSDVLFTDDIKCGLDESPNERDIKVSVEVIDNGDVIGKGEIVISEMNWVYKVKR